MNSFKLIADYIAQIPSMEGWCSAKKAEALARAALETKPEIVVEIGVFGGRSLIALALACRCNDKGITYGIDPWLPSASVEGFEHDRENRDWWGKLDHDQIYRKCMQACAIQGVLDHTVLIRAKSQQVLPLFSTCAPMIGLLHIDGNHSEETSTFDVANYVPLVRRGGVVVFDDTNWETTKKAQGMLAEMCSLDYMLDDSGQQCGFYLKR